MTTVCLPIVLSHQHVEDRIEIICKIPRDLSYCEGHFPGMPIVPGVVQLHWAVHYAKEFIKTFAYVAGASQIKFTNIISPGAEIILSLKHDVEQNMIHYTYFDAEKSYSAGRFSYGDKA